MSETAHVALITPSYRADLERCRILCETVDRYVVDQPHHYILVDADDYPLFSPLAGSRRHVVNEQDILPAWLHSLRTGVSKDARKLWWSFRTWPMRGWHVQQLRRIAIAAHLDMPGLLYCDSDMVFVKPFDTGVLWREGALRLYRKPGGIEGKLARPGSLHRKWTIHAARLNGLSAPEFPADDYINNLVSWRRDHVLAMCDLLERNSGKHWVAAMAAQRSFSECQIYGAFADGVMKGEGHWHAERGLCSTYWLSEDLADFSVERMRDTLSPKQVAIGVQSFIDVSPDDIRKLAGLDQSLSL